MDFRELALAPAWRVRDLINCREISHVEVVEAFLCRINRLNPAINAYLTVASSQALDQAMRADTNTTRCDDPGLLQGVPISVKDMLPTKGIRTTKGSLLYKDSIPTNDSIVSERLRKAGAIILGKTNVPEFGLASTTENRLGDACRNPWDTDTTVGGSSGGAASAMGAGLCSLATGGDGAGSIRIPASFCGVYGMKPTQWRVPAGSNNPTSDSSLNLFQQLGPLSRTVKDAALMLQVMTGHDDRDPLSLRGSRPDLLSNLEDGIAGLKIGWSPNLGFAAIDPEVAKINYKAATVFNELGGRVEEININIRDMLDPFLTVLKTKAATSYGHLLRQHADQLSDNAKEVIESGLAISGVEYGRALQSCLEVQAQLRGVFDLYDLILTPTAPDTAFPIGHQPCTVNGKKVDAKWGFSTMGIAFNISQQPAASVPCGSSKKGMPVGLQIIGKEGADHIVLKASAAFESARPWAKLTPPVF